VSEFSREMIARSGYELEGFADVYDEYRPAPPPALLDVLLHLAQVARPRLVIDLGTGTGLSARVWADQADEVVGIEANPRMLDRARAATEAPNVRFVEAFAADTGLPAQGADLVTCSQAFHWMEPGPVLREAARLLRPGGVFAAYDYDVPPVIQPDVDEAFRALMAARREARARLGFQGGSDTWPKHRHLQRIRESGHFHIAREVLCHGWEEADAARVDGLARSLGGPTAVFGDAAPEVDEAYARVVETAARTLGDRRRPLLLCFRIRAGIS
jgi:SAM-dependent methyltransferase